MASAAAVAAVAGAAAAVATGAAAAASEGALGWAADAAAGISGEGRGDDVEALPPHARDSASHADNTMAFAGISVNPVPFQFTVQNGPFWIHLLFV